MQYNVATLLREPPGSTRRFDVANELAEVESEGYRRPVSGEVRLLRTARGIFVRAKLQVEATYQCSRCLRDFSMPVDLNIEEMFVFTRDPVTLAPMEDIAPDDFRLQEEQYLDLSEAIRQYEEAARPISPLHRPDCAGLCPRCGFDRNEGPHECAEDELHPAWSALAGLAEQLSSTEVRDGRSEA